MTAELTAEPDFAEPPVLAAKGRAAPMAAAGSLTADLIQRRKTARMPGADMPLVGLERPIEPSPAPVQKPTASSVPPADVATATAEPPAVREPPMSDLVARASDAAIGAPSGARALRRDLNAQRQSGRLLRSGGLFLVIYVLSCALMIYALV